MSTESYLDKTAADKTREANKAAGDFAYHDGKLFGLIPMPDQKLGASLRELITRKGTTILSNFANKQGTHFFGAETGAKLGKGAAYALPLMIAAQPIYKSVATYYKDMRAFSQEWQPLFAANAKDESGQKKLFGSDGANNDIIAFARNQRAKKHGNAIASQVASNTLSAGYQISMQSDLVKDKMKAAEKAAGEHELKVGTSEMGDLLFGQIKQGVQDYINKTLPNKYNEGCSLDLCKKFRDETARLARDLDPLDEHQVARAVKDASEKMMGILKKRYVEQGWEPMSDRVKERLEEELPKLARPMVTGELSPLAVVNLLGEHKIVRDEGGTVASDEEVKNALADEMKKLSREQMLTLAEYYSQVSFKKSDIVKSLKDLGQDEKAFLAVILPDKVLYDGGATKEQVETFRKEGEREFDRQALIMVKTLAERPLDELRDVFSKKEIHLLRDLAKKLEDMENKPRRREDDIDLADEQDALLRNAKIREIIASAYVKDAKSWTEKFKKEKPAGKDGGELMGEETGVTKHLKAGKAHESHAAAEDESFVSKHAHGARGKEAHLREDAGFAEEKPHHGR